MCECHRLCDCCVSVTGWVVAEALVALVLEVPKARGMRLLRAFTGTLIVLDAQLVAGTIVREESVFPLSAVRPSMGNATVARGRPRALV